MIYLEPGHNNVVVTLSEATSYIPTSSGLTGLTMKITNLQTNDVTYFNNLVDISPNIERYNEYVVNVVTDQAAGYYDYSFYLTELSGNTIISEPLETGKCLVKIEEQVNKVYTGKDTTVKVYKK